MTFLELKQRIARRTGKNAASLDAATSTLLGDFINEAHREELRKPGRERLRQATVTFASVASQKLYALPEHGIARINRITETTNDTKLVYRTPEWLDTVAPDPTTGTPWAWVERGASAGAHTQPSDASAVFADSTSASDTGTAYVEGLRTGGFFGSASQTMTGTTAVQVGSITDWIVITKFYLSTAAVGTVTLHEDASGGTELSKIAIGDVTPHYLVFQLYPTPAAVITYTADVTRAIPDMSTSTDEPLLPVDFHDVLLYRAQMKAFTKSDDPRRWKALLDEYQMASSQLDTWLTSHPDWRPEWGAPSLERAAFAGGWWPAQVE